MPLNEPRIFETKPEWLGLPEINRTTDCVWFRTRTGRIRASLADVLRWESKNKNRADK